MWATRLRLNKAIEFDTTNLDNQPNSNHQGTQAWLRDQGTASHLGSLPYVLKTKLGIGGYCRESLVVLEMLTSQENSHN